ncbi:NADPH-dependent FMN reductase [Rhizobium sp. WYJ-E13]|uniref:NADPH-dependent FMN reductase n=1 Tax=Rhizobium sp. WYJ-E13 TaxID=2849093 RepID=UPI001C1EF3C1|nr:NAD(P)H-dependent oxidoreductase [Rhizobium sp. WYJ-E13]QWW71329.1 NAD(P)H-dependent oxidoreductase [Rhizobium sp. WYJ-E13]
MTNIETITGRAPADGALARVLAFSGSTRAGSWNSVLLGIAAEALRSQGVDVREINLRDYPFPIYDGDLESKDGVPSQVLSLRRIIKEHDGLLFACPEYNGSVTPLLKNTLDWCSRPGDGMAPLEPFRLKPSLIVGTSIGPFGGIRAIGHLRAILSKMGATVFPEDLAIPNAQRAFANGELVGGANTDFLHRLAGVFAQQLANFREAVR